MGFLSFWKNEKHSLEPSNSDSSQQLDLFKKAEIAHRKRSTRATVFRQFTGSIIVFTSLVDSTFDGPYLDNVNVEAVPTPAPLLGIFGMGIAALRNRWKKTDQEV